MQWTEIDNQGQRGLQELEMFHENNCAWWVQKYTQMQCSEISFSLHVHAGLRRGAVLPMLNEQPHDADDS